MSEFSYKAKDHAGRVRSGKVKASSKAAAKQQLQRMRLRPILIKATSLDADPDTDKPRGLISRDAKGRLVINLGEAKPSTKDLIVFTKQFATMMGSGVPLLQALGLLAEQQRVPSFGRDLGKVRYAVENGSKMSDALEAFPKHFDTLYVALVRAGEASGNLDRMMLKLTVYIEKAAKIKSQVKSAMMYPMIVVFVAVVVVSGLLVFVVPTFAKQYQDQGKPLPELTQIVVDLSDFMVNQWSVILGAVIVGIFAFRAWIRTDLGRRQFDAWILKAPGIGQLLQKVAVGRFCSTMSTMLTSGVNMLEALSICAASSGNKTIESFVVTVRERIEQGAKFSEPLAAGFLFPPMVVSMVAVGETTGALDEMLTKVSDFYEDEVDLAVKTMISMIEPLLIVVLGGIVGFVLIAMYLPVFDLGNVAGG